MTVYLDASALVAFLLGEAAEPQVRALLRDQPTAITAVNYAEVLDTVSRRRGLETSVVRATVDSLTWAGLRLETAAPKLAAEAASIRIARYHRERCAVSIADCFAVAAARSDTLATSDRDQAAVARAEGISVVALPPSPAR